MKRWQRAAGIGCGGLTVLVGLAFGGLYWRISNPPEERKPLPPGLVAADSTEGKALLASASAKADHASLSATFQTQEKGSWCGVASSVAALKAIGVAPSITQNAFHSDAAGEVRSKFAITFGGMNLDELGKLLEVHGAKATVVHAGDSSAAKFREAAARNLSTPGDVMLVNYKREKLGQGSIGHISPIAAYDAKSSRVLILDTATYKWPATWVKLETLYEAMNTLDSASGKTRGWVEVTKPSN